MCFLKHAGIERRYRRAEDDLVHQGALELWELVTVLPGPGGSDQLVAYLKRPA